MSDSTVARPWLAADLLTNAISAGCSVPEALAQASSWHTWCGEAPNAAEAHLRGDLVLARMRTGYNQVQFGGDLAAQLAEGAAWAASFIPPSPVEAVGEPVAAVVVSEPAAPGPVVAADPAAAAAVDASAPAA